jgi:uncharacterized protein
MIIDTEIDKKVYVKESYIHGKGCFAKTAIKKGDFIGEYSGPGAKKDGTYVLWVMQDDETWKGVNGKNQLKYLNHKAKPNSEFDGTKLFAVKNIKKDDEVTFHYGEEWEGR